jgi:alpha-ketoglutarate-dependent taurine dioxygenase
MNAPVFKTMSQQRLEWLESLNRPLSDDESDELRRALHAVYCRTRRENNTLRRHRIEEAELLERLTAESQMLEWHPERGR